MISSARHSSSDETPTFLNIQVPDWSPSLAPGGRDAFNVCYRDLANLQMHRSTVGGQFLEVWTELGEEWENITRVAAAVNGANLKYSDTWHGASGDTLFRDDSRGTQSILKRGKYILNIRRSTFDGTYLPIHNKLLDLEESFSSGSCG